MVLLLLIIISISCANNKKETNIPNIRKQSGIEQCGLMCLVFTELDCHPYDEDIEMDGGVMTCTEFCEYEMENSVQLNPGCIAHNLSKCDEIEEISQKCNLLSIDKNQ